MQLQDSNANPGSSPVQPDPQQNVPEPQQEESEPEAEVDVDTTVTVTLDMGSIGQQMTFFSPLEDRERKSESEREGVEEVGTTSVHRPLVTTTSNNSTVQVKLMHPDLHRDHSLPQPQPKQQQTRRQSTATTTATGSTTTQAANSSSDHKSTSLQPSSQSHTQKQGSNNRPHVVVPQHLQPATPSPEKPYFVSPIRMLSFAGEYTSENNGTLSTTIFAYLLTNMHFLTCFLYRYTHPGQQCEEGKAR